MRSRPLRARGPAAVPASGKFPSAAATEGTFEIHPDEDDFNEAAKGTAASPTPRGRRPSAPPPTAKIGGFFDRSTNAIHVRSRTKFGHALHEAMHKVAHPGFHGFWDEFINEGVTQYFADCLLREQGLADVTDHDYQDAARVREASSWRPRASRSSRAPTSVDDGALQRRAQAPNSSSTSASPRARASDNVCTRL